MFRVDLQHLSFSLLFCLIPLLFLVFVAMKNSPSNLKAPKSYPLIGSLFSIIANMDRLVQWSSDMVVNAASLTFILHRPLGKRHIITANPSVVQHMLKTNFHIYQKGHIMRSSLSDFLGDGIFNTNGESWKFQRKLSSHEFSTKSLQKFVENVVDTELSVRLIPILASAASNGTVVDFQDILQRFAFDNVCKIAFGYDPGYLLPSLPDAPFAVAFEDATQLSSDRFLSFFPIIWKIKRFLNVGSERKLKDAVKIVHAYAREIIKEKKQELERNSSITSVDILSRFLDSGISNEHFFTDIIISYILAGRDTTSAALTWFFWSLSGHPEIENNVLMEIQEKNEAPVYEEVKDMIYTHASLCESMRLYPPVPVDSKEAVENDVLPEGTFVRKGDRVTYHSYAMGRVEEVWGSDWAEFRPERWLEREDVVTGNWRFVARDAYTYPVFHAGPRVCLGKEMAFLQMKRVVAGVLWRFRVVPAIEKGVEPVFVVSLTSKMKGGFPVRIEERVTRSFN